MVDESAAHEAKETAHDLETPRPLLEGRLGTALIDHQSGIMQLNHDPTPAEFRSAAIALAKAGKIFDLPTIITSSYERRRHSISPVNGADHIRCLPRMPRGLWTSCA
jgi:hypothetical protein